jgi:beta-glucanase (GH16 family)
MNRFNILSIICCIVALVSAAAAQRSGLKNGETAPAGYKLVWADEFNKDGPPDPCNWTYERGFVRNQELQWYQPENARCENGLLVIEGRRERKENPRYRPNGTSWRENRQYAEYTSACLTTRGLHKWMYGRFEMRGRIDTRPGLWPAFWTLGAQGGWPACGEIDIMEYYRGMLLANAAWASQRQWSPVWDDVKIPLSKFKDPDWSKQFHVWRMNWDPDNIKLYVDDALLNTIELSKTLNRGSEGKNPFHQPHYIILNLAIGGTSGGDPANTAFPAKFEVDYVRIYQKQPQGGAAKLDASFFKPPAEFAGDFGSYKSPLIFDDGTVVKTPADWQRRRREILKTWTGLMGAWPPLVKEPKIEYLATKHRENFTQHKVRVEIAPDGQTVDGYLLVPDGAKSCPAVLVVYYDAETGIGLGREGRDFAYQLAKRGFVTLSIGTPEFASLKPPYKVLYDWGKGHTPLQPLSALAYVAANCHTALANLPEVDPNRIGVVGHSYGGKWAMFASCLYDKFACAVWSDPGIVFDESRPNINYWEPWYLGYDPNQQRHRGIPSASNPRTGAYKKMVEEGRDLPELHALMSPRPFLVSGGAEDRPKRWKALNHTVAINKLLGYTNRVALTSRNGHSPTPESNEQIYSFFEQFLMSPR